MVRTTKPSVDIKISCDVCKKEIPLSEAMSAEAVDYVVHVCGLDCYNEWKKRGTEAVKSGDSRKTDH